MNTKEIIKKVRYVEIKSRRIVDSILSGGYHSAFKGKGMEFSEVREYIHGDDIRHIDWNVSARSSHPYVKVYHEERELTVLLVVDASASLEFGTRGAPKKEIAAEIAALLAFSAIKNNDNVGLLMFSDECEKYIPPKKGKKHVMRLIREILFFTPRKKATSLRGAMEMVIKTLKKKSVVFVLSDFIDTDWKKAMAIANKKHEIIPLLINDPMEMNMPRGGLIELYDPEKGEQVLVDLASETFRKKFAAHSLKSHQQLLKLMRSIDLDPISISSAQSYIIPLVKYFKLRKHRR